MKELDPGLRELVRLCRHDHSGQGRLVVADRLAAMGLQRQLTELFDPLIQAPDFPEGFRVGAEARGFAMGASRQPATEAQVADRRKLAERIRSRLDGLGLR